METYDIVRSEVRRFGKNSYLEVARHRFRGARDATDFIVLTRGFFDRDGTRQWTRYVTIPDDEDLKAWVREWVGKV